MINMRIGKISQFIFMSYGYCLHCGTTWNLVESHVTQYTESMGCFPLCEKCWSELNITQRLNYYYQLINQWEDKDDNRKDNIIKAVKIGG